MDTIEYTRIAALLPEFRECHEYADRLAFWDRHWDTLRLADCGGRCNKKCTCDVELCYSGLEFDDDNDAGRARINFGMRLWLTCKTWEDVQQWPILTLTPFTRQEAEQFVKWALNKRPNMSGAPKSSQDLKADFEKQYAAIPSNLDRAEFLEKARTGAYTWKNDQLTGGYAHRASIGEALGLNMDLYSEFAKLNKLGLTIDLARHLTLANANLTWAVIDTYLFAKSKYDFALFLEHFELQKANAKIEQTARSATSTVSQVNYDEVISRILAPLNGLNHSKMPIMSDNDFSQLIEHTKFLVSNDSVPTIKKPFPQLDISNDHIRYTFYRLHKELFGTRRIRHSFINFLQALFVQLSNTQWLTTKKKFKTAPKSYYRDFGLSD